MLARRRRQMIERQRDDDIHAQQHHAFHPVAFAVLADHGQDRHRKDDGDHLQSREMEVQRLLETEHPAQRDAGEHQHRGHEQGNLQALPTAI